MFLGVYWFLFKLLMFSVAVLDLVGIKHQHAGLEALSETRPSLNLLFPSRTCFFKRYPT